MIRTPEGRVRKAYESCFDFDTISSRFYSLYYRNSSKLKPKSETNNDISPCFSSSNPAALYCSSFYIDFHNVMSESLINYFCIAFTST